MTCECHAPYRFHAKSGVSQREDFGHEGAQKGAMLIGNLEYLSSLLVATKRIEQVTHVDSSHNEAITIEVKLLDRDG